MSKLTGKKQKLKCVYPPRFKKFLKLEAGGGNESDEEDLDVINCATTVIGKINALKKWNQFTLKCSCFVRPRIHSSKIRGLCLMKCQMT